MAHSNGIITAPVSFGDVNAVLRTSHTDLKTMCKDSNIKWYSKYKPTSYTGIGFALGTSGIEDYLRGAPINALNFGCGLQVPSTAISAQATVTLGSGSTVSLIQYLEQWQSSYGQYCVLSANVSALANAWAKPNITVGRLTDFHRYTHNSPQYELGDKPFTCSVALPQQEGRLVIDASAQIIYNYNDKANGVGAWLGVNTLFCQGSGQGQYGGVSMTINGYTGIRFFTVIVYCASTGKMLLSRQAFKTITTDNDSETGLPYNRYVTIPTSGAVGTAANCVAAQGETVIVAPCIVARNTNGNYVFFSLNCEATYSKSFTLRSDTPTLQEVHINSISATITYVQVSGRTYDIYFNGASAFTVSCSGASSNTYTNKVFYISNIMYITPADATGSMSEQIGLTLGSGLDEGNGYRFTRVTTNSPQGYIFNGGNLSFTNLRSRITFSGSGSSAKVGITIPVYHNSGSSTMVRKFFNLTFTIDPTKTGSNTASASAT